MKFTLQTAILLVFVSLVHVAVIAQFLPEHSVSPASGASVSEGMIGPQVSSHAASSDDVPASDQNIQTETETEAEAPDLADLVKDASASFPEFEGPEGSAGESVESEKSEISSAPLVNPEAETVLARMPPEQPTNVAADEKIGSPKPASEAPASEHADPVAQVRPQSEPSASTTKSSAADALKVRLISPLP